MTDSPESITPRSPRITCRQCGKRRQYASFGLCAECVAANPRFAEEYIAQSYFGVSAGQIECSQGDGRPAFRDGLCLPCLNQRWRRGALPEADDYWRQGAPSFDGDQRQRLLKRWNLPDSTPSITQFVDAGELDERWKGYRAELVLIQPIGQALNYPWQIDTSGKLQPMQKSPQAITVTSTATLGFTAVLSLRLFHSKRQGFMTGCWNPGTDEPSWQLPKLTRQSEREEWHRLIREPAQSGRRPGTGMYANKDYFLKCCKDVQKGLPSGVALTPSDLAAGLKVAPRTVTRAMRDHNLTWDDIIKHIME